MEPLDPHSGPPRPLTRDVRGRWVAGVCEGIARTRGVPVGRLRAGFALAALAGGLGLLAYGACWLIIPAEGDTSATKGSRAVVLLAQSCAALAGLVTLMGAAGVATLFGFGWFVLLAAAVLLAGVLFAWPKAGPAWVLLPLSALVVPALALAAGRVELDPSTADRHVTPPTTTAFPAGGYRSGLGHLFVDLRRTSFPATGTVRLAIRGGVRRTIVALPHDRCVHLDLRWRVRPFATRLARLLDGSYMGQDAELIAFGQPMGGSVGAYADRLTSHERRPAPGPTLQLRFESAGGSLVVRDFPDAIDPQQEPHWPGLSGGVEPKPFVEGVSREERRRLMDAWRGRAREQRREQQRIDAAMAGPCWTTAVSR